MRTGEDCVAVLCAKVLLHNLLAVMRIITTITLVSDLQMDRRLVYASGRTGFEAGFAIRTWVAFHKFMFSIHVSLQVATRRTSESAKVTLLPILFIVDLLMAYQAVLIWTLEIALAAPECSSVVFCFCVVSQLAWHVCSVVTPVTHQLLVWGLQTMHLIFVA